MSRMTQQSQLIFDKSDSVCSRTEEYKNHSHTLKLKNSEVIIIKAAEILAYMSLNSS
jgi:co-chaperonin GroES (HSP10)